MTAPSAPREWLWVGSYINYRGDKFAMLEGPDLLTEKLWLVEKDLLTALQKENERIENLLKFYADRIERDKHRVAEVKSLEAKLEIAREALEAVVRRHEAYGSVGDLGVSKGIGTVCKKALSRITEGEGK